MIKRKRKKFTDEEKEIILSLWKQGYTATQICRQVDSLKDRKPQTLYPILIKKGLYKKKSANDLRKYKVNDHYFDTIDNEHKAYWLGFMLADGFICNSGHATETFGITLKSDDKYILEKFNNDLSSTYKIHDYVEKHDFGYGERITHVSRLLIKSKNIFNKLCEMGFSSNKSYSAFIPFEFIPQTLINHFVRGYFDGDGGLCKYGKKSDVFYNICFTGTTEVIEGLRDILNKKELKLFKRYPNRNNNNCSLRISGRLQVYNICKWMYNNSTVFLKRKYERFKKLESNILKQGRSYRNVENNESPNLF